MAALQSKCSPASNSLVTAWNAAVEEEVDTASETLAELTLLEPGDVNKFIESVLSHLQQWSNLFDLVPKEHELRKDALGGALKMKQAAKRFEKVAASLVGTDGDAGYPNVDSTSKDAQEPSTSGSISAALTDSLIELQAAFHDMVYGLLRVSFPVDEFISSGDFKDASLAESLQRWKLVEELTLTLAKIFIRSKVELKQLRTSEDAPLAPEVLKMLEKSMKKQQKKDGKKGNNSASASLANFNAARAVWEQREGRCSRVLGEEVWEGICWREGMFLFGYVEFLLGERRGEKTDAVQGEEKVSAALFKEALQSFHKMLIAQGPIAANMDDPAVWQSAADGPHQEEPARMHYHGMYTSMHLRALKHVAELTYWQWKHRGHNVADAKLSAIINRKFVHVVSHIMPQRGWTCEIELERIFEMEKTTLDSSEYSDGLAEKAAINNAKPKPPKVAAVADKKSKSNKSGAAGTDSAGKSNSDSKDKAETCTVSDAVGALSAGKSDSDSKGEAETCTVSSTAEPVSQSPNDC